MSLSETARELSTAASGAVYQIGKATGTVDDFAQQQPFTNVAPPDSEGYPFGYLKTGGRFLCDLLNWQRDGFIGGPVYGIFGDRGSTKTTLMKEYGLFMASSDVGRGGPAHIAADIVRVNAGVNEWKAMADFFETEVVDMEKAGFNPLSRGTGLPLNRLTEWQIDALEHRSQALTLGERFGLSACMANLYRQVPADRDPNYADLMEVISRFDVEAELEHYRVSVEAEQFSDEIKEFMRSDIDPRELADVRRNLRRRLSLILGASFGGVFSSTSARPIESVLKSQIQVLDYSRLTPMVTPIVQALIFEIRDYATMIQNWDLMVEYEPFDETNRLLRQPITAKRILDRLKVIRGTAKVMGLSWHRPQDAFAIGDHDSELRNVVTDLLEEIEVAFIGQIKGPRTLRAIAEWKDLPGGVMKRISRQAPGEFCVIIDGRDPFFIERPLNDTLKMLSESNMANRRKSDRETQKEEQDDPS